VVSISRLGTAGITGLEYRTHAAQQGDVMRRFIYAVLVLLAWHPGLALADGEVGVITEVSGEAELLRGDQVLAAETGVNLMPGDVVRTGDDASAQIDMDDGSSFAMGANSSLRIHEYRMRQDHSIIAAAIDKISGWMRFAVAKLRQADYYRFQMPTAVLGVRGTEGVLNVEGEGSSAQSNIMLDKGNVEVAERVANGRLAGNRLRLKSGEYAYRRFGRMLSMRRHFPEQLRRRMPAFVRARLVRRVRFLKRRGIRPRRIEGRLFRMQRRQGIRRMERPTMRRMQRPGMRRMQRPGMRRMQRPGMRRMQRPGMRRMENQPGMMRQARPATRQAERPALKQQDGADSTQHHESATQQRPAAKRLLKNRRRFLRFRGN
jgi:hypothetical protein